MTDYPDWQTPQAHATQIFATGVPLYAKSNLVVNDQTRVLAASGTATLGPVTVGQIGYEVALTVLANVASLAPWLKVELVWTDSTTGLTVGHERWVLTGGTVSGGANILGAGESKADTLSIILTNLDAVNAMTVTTVLGANSRVYTRDDWRTENYNTPPGFALPSRQQQSGILGAFNTNINAGNVQDRLLPLYAGVVMVQFTTNAAKGELRLLPQDPELGAWTTSIANKAVLAAGSASVQQWALGRGPYVMECANTDVAAGIFDWSVVLAEQLS